MSLDTADQDLMWPMDVEYSLVDNSSTKAIIQVGPYYNDGRAKW